MVTLSSAVLCLAMAVYHESRGEPTIAQRGVAHVVMNRSINRDKEVCEVVTEKHQFSWVKNGNKGKPAKEVEPFFKAVRIASEVIEREKDMFNGANHFWDDSIPPPRWAKSCKWVKKHGRVNFCYITPRRQLAARS